MFNNFIEHKFEKTFYKQKFCASPTLKNVFKFYFFSAQSKRNFLCTWPKVTGSYPCTMTLGTRKRSNFWLHHLSNLRRDVRMVATAKENVFLEGASAKLVTAEMIAVKVSALVSVTRFG